MNNVIFDCERMKYENTGLFSHDFQLGSQLEKIKDPTTENITFFVPPKFNGIFGKYCPYIIQHSLQKFYLPSLKGYHVWHCTYQNSEYVPVINRKIKVVLTIHDLNFLYNDAKPDFKKKKYLRHLQRNIDRSSHIVCISEFCKKDVLENCEIGNKPITVIHNGTSTLEAPSLVTASYKPRTRFLFSIGVMNRNKNFHSLLPLLQHNENMELLIAGRPDDADYISYIKDSARKLGVEQQVKVLGVISEPEKSWYYENCYAFTCPSLAEGFGLPVTEAMSVGKPLFLANKTSLPEIGKDVAFYFKDFNGQQMQNVFSSGMKTYSNSNMKDAIKKRSTDFSWEKASKQYLEIYRSL
jgi:glycosyltransferase involved in cell wall biosynthesis